MDEVRAIKAAERFAAADADGNGELTSEEMLAAAGPHGRAHGAPDCAAVRAS